MARSTQLQNNKRNLIAHSQPKSPTAEAYRTIRTNIQYASPDKQIRTIMVTSSEPGEGKTTTISNLAVVMAQQGKKTLLIDCDMRKPTVHSTFLIPNTRGLTNLLTHQAQFKDVIQDTAIENLQVISSGPIPPNPAELLSTKTMEQLINELLAEYDYVFFDTPPVLAVTDAQVLASYCDGVVLVIASGKTVREGAKKAVELLKVSKAKILGTVLNGKKQKESEYYYYYGK